jgi:hypothetical protein
LRPPTSWTCIPACSFGQPGALTLELGWNLLWRESVRDAVYRTPLVPIEGTAGASGRFIGHQAIVGIEWQLSRARRCGAVRLLLAGSALRQAGGSQVDFLFTSVAWKF